MNLPELRLVLRHVVVLGWLLVAAEVSATSWRFFQVGRDDPAGIDSISIGHVLMTVAALAALRLGLRSARALTWAVIAIQVGQIAHRAFIVVGSVRPLDAERWLGWVGAGVSFVFSILLTWMCVEGLRASGANPAPVAVPAVPEPLEPPLVMTGGVWRSAQDAAAGSAPVKGGTITDPADPWRRGTPSDIRSRLDGSE